MHEAHPSNPPTLRRSPRRLAATAAVGVALFAGSAVALTGFAGAASAQDNPAASSADAGQARPGVKHPRLRQAVKGAVRTAADAIGIDARTLVTEAKGSSIANVATAHGVDPQVVVDALVAKGQERIDQAVANGKLTAEKAAEISAKLPEKAALVVNHVFDGSHRPNR